MFDGFKGGLFAATQRGIYQQDISVLTSLDKTRVEPIYLGNTAGRGGKHPFGRVFG